MNLGKLLQEAKRAGRARINVQAPRNIKVAKNVAKNGGQTRARAEQHVEIKQQGGRDVSDNQRHV